jgi:indolepyruvate ferredoxin oxidoreductase alpha subunit
LLERYEDDFVAPDLLWSEATSALHEYAWRNQVAAEEMREALALVRGAPVLRRRPRGLRDRAWQIADRMGWAKTYDAEYCAVAELLRCELVTTDRRLRAAGARLGYVITPAEAVERIS